jgi:hypothetical protein
MVGRVRGCPLVAASTLTRAVGCPRGAPARARMGEGSPQTGCATFGFLVGGGMEGTGKGDAER